MQHNETPLPPLPPFGINVFRIQGFTSEQMVQYARAAVTVAPVLLPHDRRTQARPKPPVDFEGEETVPRALEAERLRRVVRALGLDDHVPEDDGQMRDVLFAVLGIIARRVETNSARLERAERALVRAGFVDHGAQEWKPPLGPAPRFVQDGLTPAEVEQFKEAWGKMPPITKTPPVIYSRNTTDPDDSNTRTTSVDVARRWKSNGSFVTPDPEVTNA